VGAAGGSRWATQTELADLSDTAALRLEGAARKGVLQCVVMCCSVL